MPETSWEQDTIGAIITVLETSSGDFHVAGDFFRDFHGAGDFLWRFSRCWRLLWKDFHGAGDFSGDFQHAGDFFRGIFTLLETSSGIFTVL